MYELIIIGAGPAGITAAVYAARKKIKFLIISKDVGGQAAWSGDIENYTGYQFVTGPELAMKFEEHMKQFKVDLKEGEDVKSLEKSGDNFKVVTDKGSYEAQSIIIASGKKPRMLGVPGETKFKSKGVTYCATCDGPLFSGKDVAVIGGGNSALDAALQMMKIANKVYLINVNPELGGDAVMIEKVKKDPKVEIMNGTKTIEIYGEKFLTGMKVESQGKARDLKVQGIFVEIGLIPNTDFVSIVEKNKAGEIVTDSNAKTSIEGVFAAGDVTNQPEKQIIIAAGDGAKALLGAYSYLVHR
ncbi:NAD(P)/FAD-dependent oxidoreductase [Candidatus Margulisiibacteriota bacterium]